MKKMILISAILCASAAHAGETPINKIEREFKVCAENSQSTLESNECSYDAYKKADDELNRVYRAIRAKLSQPASEDYNQRFNVEASKRLLAAQRAWVTYRDAHCSEVGLTMFEGSGEGVMIGDCLATMTIERVKTLQDLY